MRFPCAVSHTSHTHHCCWSALRDSPAALGGRCCWWLQTTAWSPVPTGWEKITFSLGDGSEKMNSVQGFKGCTHLFSSLSACKGRWSISKPLRQLVQHDASVCILQGVGSQSFIFHYWLIVYAEVSGNISDIYLIHMFCFQVYRKGSAVKEHIIYTMIHSRENEERLTLEIFMPFSICIHHQMYFWFLTCKGFF